MKRILILAVLFCFLCVPTNATKRPNIILILADDMGWRDPACFGGKAVPTPHMDALATSGIKMTRFYSFSAVCTPTRVEPRLSSTPAIIEAPEAQNLGRAGLMMVAPRQRS